ncbi:MAG: mannose-1-phosphate guanylyltransferase/mannose-6-phosphate isomerase [Rhodospirillales bacterium]|nr:mannose-1-phosphate guanylyltransferase/mannose-6-phosphate isomerase [Rhodospirillales bacterium]
MNDKIHPVILSGGAGSRLWPVSRMLFPKQLLPLASDRSMIQETASRVSGPGFEAPLVICNEEHRFAIAEQLRQISITPSHMVLEPAGRNTAPAATIAALMLHRLAPDALVLLLPSDHVIADSENFLDAIFPGLAPARAGALVTFGIKPATPETGYGYIRTGEPFPHGDDCYHVEKFVEKPDLKTAQGYIENGGYLWNSGMFLFRADSFLEDLGAFKPEILESCHAAITAMREDLDFLRLDRAAFEKVESISIDHAVMEKTSKAACVPLDVGWNDVGSWSALWDLGNRDEDGNVIKGEAVLWDTRNSYIRSEGPLVATVGVENMVVVATDDAVLVVPKDKSQDTRAIVDELKARGRTEHAYHTRVYRPWGYYQNIDVGPGYQVKHILVSPGAKLSLQLHHKRAEHWVVLSGTARVIRDEEILTLGENDSIDIPLGAKHSLENPADTPLRIIEVQSGSYLGEDDIVRFEDIYGRAGHDDGNGGGS